MAIGLLVACEEAEEKPDFLAYCADAVGFPEIECRCIEGSIQNQFEPRYQVEALLTVGQLLSTECWRRQRGTSDAQAASPRCYGEFRKLPGRLGFENWDPQAMVLPESAREKLFRLAFLCLPSSSTLNLKEAVITRESWCRSWRAWIDSRSGKDESPPDDVAQALRMLGRGLHQDWPAEDKLAAMICLTHELQW